MLLPDRRSELARGKVFPRFWGGLPGDIAIGAVGSLLGASGFANAGAAAAGGVWAAFGGLRGGDGARELALELCLEEALEAALRWSADSDRQLAKARDAFHQVAYLFERSCGEASSRRDPVRRS